MSFPRYPEYKDSGVEWLGEVPEHWEVCALKRMFQVMGGSTPKSEHEAFWDGDVVWITPADLGQLSGFSIYGSSRQITQDGLASCGTTLVPCGSIVLSTRAPIGYIGIADVSLCTNQGCKALVPSSGAISRFYAYLFSVVSEELNIRGRGATFLELSADALGAFVLCAPSVSEQSAIAAFLDRETGKIDALVAEQEKLIALLTEKRRAVISHAVTKGLNPAAPMKDSGIEWLGEVPAHWTVVSLKHLVSNPIIDGPHETPMKCDEGIPFVSAESVSQGFINFEKMWGYISPDDHEQYSKRYSPKRGDILLVKLGATTGTTALVETDDDFNIWVPLAAIRLSIGIIPKFILHVLRSNSLMVAYELNWTYGTQQTLGLRTISNLRIPLPPDEEQREIVNHLDSVIPSLETLIAEALHAIDLLKEHRSALISAAVTGKIDVRGLVEREAA
ncbi:MAG: restriction endonuclease subunit S [Rhodospirillaceae bacterium]